MGRMEKKVTQRSSARRLRGSGQRFPCPGRHRSRRALLVTLATLLVASLTGTSSAKGRAWRPKKGHVERVEQMPDLPQIQSALPDRGRQYCAPVSVSNGLAWLSQRGYARLMEGEQIELARVLGSAAHMHTDEKTGTGVAQVLEGLKTYLKHRKVKVKRLEFQGWRHAPGTFRAGKKDGRVSLKWLLEGTKGRKCVAFLNMGWYRREKKDFKRLGGHWVTLVGYEVTGKSLRLVVHDPSARSPEGRHERVDVVALEQGKLTGTKNGLPREAAGMLRLAGDLKINRRKGADVAILDAAVVLELR